MRKLAVLSMLAFAVCFVLAGCGSKDESKKINITTPDGKTSSIEVK
jgi:uncharacterized lipoprotein YehR (DUF1307 family)